MRENQLLDDEQFGKQLKDRILNENQVQINRYLFSFLDDDTLLVEEMPSKSWTPIVGASIFGLMAGFWVFVIVGTYRQHGPEEVSSLLYVLCGFSLLVSLYFLWSKYWSKSSWEFGPDYLKVTNMFGSVRTHYRKNFKSIFTQKTIHRTNGSVSNVTYTVALAMKEPELDGKQLDLMTPDDSNSIASAFSRPSFDEESRAHGECIRMIELISFHWDIPAGV